MKKKEKHTKRPRPPRCVEMKKKSIQEGKSPLVASKRNKYSMKMK